MTDEMTMANGVEVEMVTLTCICCEKTSAFAGVCECDGPVPDGDPACPHCGSVEFEEWGSSHSYSEDFCRGT